MTKTKKQKDIAIFEIDLSNCVGFDYNDWFKFFQRVNAGALEDNQEVLKRQLPGDGYAAMCRWLEIFEKPDKMEKIYKAKMNQDQEREIIDKSVGEDDEAFYEALIKKNATDLSGDNISPQEVARLSANIDNFRTKLREIRSRKPKKGTRLAEILDMANSPTKKTVKKRKQHSKTKKPTSVNKRKTPIKAVGAKVKTKTVTKSKKAKK